MVFFNAQYSNTRDSTVFNSPKSPISPNGPVGPKSPASPKKLKFQTKKATCNCKWPVISFRLNYQFFFFLRTTTTAAAATRTRTMIRMIRPALDFFAGAGSAAGVAAG